MTTAVPQPPPKGYLLIGIIFLSLLFVVWMFTGCVSIKTHELAKIENYEAGVEDGVRRSLCTLKASNTKDDAEYELKAFLDLAEMKK